MGISSIILLSCLVGAICLMLWFITKKKFFLRGAIFLLLSSISGVVLVLLALSGM